MEYLDQLRDMPNFHKPNKCKKNLHMRNKDTDQLGSILGILGILTW